MNIKIINDEKNFKDLKNEWDRLSQNLLSFHKFDWIYKWWKNFNDGQELRIIVAEENGKVVGIAPLFIKVYSMSKYPVYNELCFLGDKITSYADFLIDADENKEQIFQELLYHAINYIPCDAVALRNINSAYPNFSLWKKFTAFLDMDCIAVCDCPRISLYKYRSYDEYYNNLGKKLRRNLHKLSNKIDKERIKLEYIFKEDTTPDDLERIAELNMKRQKQLYEKGDKTRFCYFTDARKKQFISDFFCNGGNESKLLAVIKHEEEIISYFLGMHSDKTFSIWNTGFDPEYYNLAPSKLLLNKLIQHSFENGYKYFDFMRGTEAYKLEWTKEISCNYTFSIRKTLKGKVAYFCRNTMPKSLLPSQIGFQSDMVK